ncbi:hypothetical protein K3181_11710 [Qipengyuania sp. YG27]|uniref:Uncharacterized protein n=1 Tax=Qipengyuania mesophila TaxID=2867246 RepID=A0ABS7JWS3_9SPHN|nr:hypothetical protein [Qipengyuania mesophila]MBX7502110.1 hypothetical protein [Qipengyuania mesophila]
MDLHHRIGFAPVGARIVAHDAQGPPGDGQFLELFDRGQALDQDLSAGIAALGEADELGLGPANMDAVGPRVDPGEGVQPDREGSPDREADQQHQGDHRGHDGPFCGGVFEAFGMIERHEGTP